MMTDMDTTDSDSKVTAEVPLDTRMDVSDSDDSLSSDESSDDEERINEYRERLNSNQYDFQSHFQLLRLLRKAGELVELRERRRKFADLFPLPEG
jgi:hypothetical protein